MKMSKKFNFIENGNPHTQTDIKCENTSISFKSGKNVKSYKRHQEKGLMTLYSSSSSSSSSPPAAPFNALTLSINLFFLSS